MPSRLSGTNSATFSPISTQVVVIVTPTRFSAAVSWVTPHDAVPASGLHTRWTSTAR